MRKRVVGWPVMVAACLAVLCAFTLGMVNNAGQAKEATDKEAALQYALTKVETDVLNRKKDIDNVGSDSYVENTARTTLKYMKQGELRFEVVNSELLDNYTPEELQILADEMAQPDR